MSSKYQVWECRIYVPANSNIPHGFDYPPRSAAQSVIESAGIEVIANFSGWAGTPQEREVAFIENRLPDTAPQPQPVQTAKRCEPCRSTGLVHCANPDECGGPWTETTTQPVHTDDLAVDKFASAMKAKLAAAREKGLEGWEECSAEFLSRRQREHVEKGDPRDVANFAMFLWSLGFCIAPQPVQREPLSEEQIVRLSASYSLPYSVISFSRAIEAAHGITKKGGEA